MSHPSQVKAYEVHYADTRNQPRIFCCYATDSFHARQQAEELIQQCSRINRIRLEKDGFDW